MTTELDAICLGESMVMFSSSDRQPIEERPSFQISAGGAESNVACVLAQLGHSAAWVSRLGRDPMGRLVEASIAACGVDTSEVVFDEARPTGIYLKAPAPGGSETYYYRGGSAASAMGPELLPGLLRRRPTLLHFSGITPALSASCLELTTQVMRQRAPGSLVSFDINYRSALWSLAEAGRTLLELARGADIVFVGLDEAHRIWGVHSADQVRHLLPEVGTVVVKDGGNGVTAFEGTQTTYAEAVPIRVVEPIGAGDAFAGGYLAGMLEGSSLAERLRLGHVMAAMTMLHAGDFSHVPPRAMVDELVGNGAGWPHTAAVLLSEDVDGRPLHRAAQGNTLTSLREGGQASTAGSSSSTGA